MSAVPEPESDIPARRLQPRDHLKRAAQSGLASDAERYHLDAATAEALTSCSEQLRDVVAWLARIANAIADRQQS
jgi:hypothetical protein